MELNGRSSTWNTCKGNKLRTAGMKNVTDTNGRNEGTKRKEGSQQQPQFSFLNFLPLHYTCGQFTTILHSAALEGTISYLTPSCTNSESVLNHLGLLTVKKRDSCVIHLSSSFFLLSSSSFLSIFDSVSGVSQERKRRA